MKRRISKGTISRAHIGLELSLLFLAEVLFASGVFRCSRSERSLAMAEAKFSTSCKEARNKARGIDRIGITPQLTS